MIEAQVSESNTVNASRLVRIVPAGVHALVESSLTTATVVVLSSSSASHSAFVLVGLSVGAANGEVEVWAITFSITALSVKARVFDVLSSS